MRRSRGARSPERPRARWPTLTRPWVFRSWPPPCGTEGSAGNPGLGSDLTGPETRSASGAPGRDARFGPRQRNHYKSASPFGKLRSAAVIETGISLTEHGPKRDDAGFGIRAFGAAHRPFSDRETRDPSRGLRPGVVELSPRRRANRKLILMRTCADLCGRYISPVKGFQNWGGYILRLDRGARRCLVGDARIRAYLPPDATRPALGRLGGRSPDPGSIFPPGRRMASGG